jgi:hypothetical protein
MLLSQNYFFLAVEYQSDRKLQEKILAEVQAEVEKKMADPEGLKLDLRWKRRE